MQVGEIIKHKQPKAYKRLKAKAKRRKKKPAKLSFREIESLMRHDGYRRDGGAIRQVRHGR